MKLERRRDFIAVLGVGLIAGTVSAAFVIAVMWFAFASRLTPEMTQATSQTPLLDKLDTLSCPRGLSLVTQVRGQEDGFSRDGDEPSAIDPSLRQYASFDDLYEGRVKTYGLRSFDETGSDKLLLQHFDMPKGVVSGTLLLRIKGGGRGADNDYVRLLTSAHYLSQTGAQRLIGFSLSLQASTAETTAVGNSSAPINHKKDNVSGQDRILAIKLDAFQPHPSDPTDNLIDYFEQIKPTTNAPNLLTLGVYDDTVVDVAALSLCVKPEQVQGVTFVEHTDKLLGDDVSMLSCALDETQSQCGPYMGDTLCTQLLPLACYKDGANPKPASLATTQIIDANFVGGEVRATEPIAGSTFATIGDADKYCVGKFGAGWRVLTYQEGGGGTVISRSKIKPKTRLWIDIRDQPAARCWDREN